MARRKGNRATTTLYLDQRLLALIDARLDELQRVSTRKLARADVIEPILAAHFGIEIPSREDNEYKPNCP